VGADGGHDGCNQLRDQFIYEFNSKLAARSMRKSTDGRKDAGRKRPF